MAKIHSEQAKFFHVLSHLEFNRRMSLLENESGPRLRRCASCGQHDTFIEAGRHAVMRVEDVAASKRAGEARRRSSVRGGDMAVLVAGLPPRLLRALFDAGQHACAAVGHVGHVAVWSEAFVRA